MAPTGKFYLRPGCPAWIKCRFVLLWLKKFNPSTAFENRILPSLYRSRKHSEKDVSSVVIHCRKFFSHFPHIGFGRITHNASLPDRWLQQVIFTFDQAAQPESSAVLSCYGWTSWIQVQPEITKVGSRTMYVWSAKQCSINLSILLSCNLMQQKGINWTRNIQLLGCLSVN